MLLRVPVAVPAATLTWKVTVPDWPGVTWARVATKVLVAAV